ncbi:MAG TPA: hypothetical protein VND93_04355 [Myxococcales bacterium]|nr:hypothetical protein [Myxococcales bacterium]
MAFSVGAEPYLTGNRFSYTDAGRRYEVSLEDGRVLVTRDGQPVPLSESWISHQEKRHPAPSPAPRFSMVAASNGRIFAKLEGQLAFAIASLEPADVHLDPAKGLISIPHACFALDPELNSPRAQQSDLVQPLRDHAGSHPFTERFGLLAKVLEGGGLGFRVSFMDPGVWYWLDTRPPVLAFDVSEPLAKTLGRAGLFQVSSLLGGLITTQSVDLKQVGQVLNNLLAPAPAAAPVDGLELHAVTRYRNPGGDQKVGQELKAAEVLSIGVGHVHIHEQYERRYGGELQPLQLKNPLAEGERLAGVTYRLFNGPVRDYDGFIDGTCNYYVLCRFNDEPRFGVLWTDEQSYFAGRWRLLHPTKDSAGMTFSLASELSSNPALYDFDPSAFWSPFDDGCINPDSRMAVARQVLAVTGQHEGRGELYTINFSWASCDRTWRWRRYPQGLAVVTLAKEDEPIGPQHAPADPAAPGSICPQTLRLREDMTLAIKGVARVNGAWTPGRWTQKYLPADNRLVPEFLNTDIPRASPRPLRGYDHPWQFWPEPAFQLADQHPFFGVYQSVNSRSQYYRVELSEQDAAMVRAHPEAARWLAQPGSLYLNVTRVHWDAAGPGEKVSVAGLLGADAKSAWTRRPSPLYEDGPFSFKLLDRGRLGWIAVYWDKRDDDLAELSDLPRPVTLSLDGSPETRVRVTFRGCELVYDPPVVQRAALRLGTPAGGQVPVTVELETYLTPAALLENLWAVRAGAIAGGQPVRLLDARFSDFQRTPGGAYTATFPVPEGHAALLTEPARLANATSIWFEDVTGHVATPDRLDLPLTAP